MLTRRRFLGYSALTPAIMAYRPLLHSVMAQTPRDPSRPPIRLAVLGNTYTYGSSLQTITDRFLVGYPLRATGICRMCSRVNVSGATAGTRDWSGVWPRPGGSPKVEPMHWRKAERASSISVFIPTSPRRCAVEATNWPSTRCSASSSREAIAQPQRTDSLSALRLLSAVRTGL